MPAKYLALAFLLLCSGCALPAVLEGPSLALSVASMGQTAYTAYDAVSEQNKTKIAEMPQQYRNNRERMLVEMWEAGYYLVRALHWEEEEMSAAEQNSELAKQARLCGAEFVLLGKHFMRKAFKREEYAVYLTPAGVQATPPSGGPAPFSVELRESVVSYDVFSYSAYFFATDSRADGILSADGPWSGPCRSAYSYGAQIVALRKNSPARSAGLQPGDVIASVNGRPAEPRNLSALFEPGVNEVIYCRGGQKHSRQVHLPSL